MEEANANDNPVGATSKPNTMHNIVIDEINRSILTWNACQLTHSNKHEQHLRLTRK